MLRRSLSDQVKQIEDDEQIKEEIRYNIIYKTSILYYNILDCFSLVLHLNIYIIYRSKTSTSGSSNDVFIYPADFKPEKNFMFATKFLTNSSYTAGGYVEEDNTTDLLIE